MTSIPWEYVMKPNVSSRLPLFFYLSHFDRIGLRCIRT
ncbi:hypothetical protein LEP1GSC103_0282 [Leptospira borgpetersenii serovar Javanica str. UI 09931]|uniref:Uncharacterized protein n=1 Tax=Leptospira borgpetersenii serovar Javanica str. UI 09931 TaxID=1049767 RepID=A0AAV3JEE2_LEPBO|nr:hypothetical protein LEP1GSC103_0282 [Leptospira borgpetersenii serovar Javanica str. UI 09931]